MKRQETKCPKCGEKIFNLIQVNSEVVEYKVFLDPYDGQYASERIGCRDDGEVIHYECPACEEVVCYSLAEAEAILRGEAK